MRRLPSLRPGLPSPSDPHRDLPQSDPEDRKKLNIDEFSIDMSRCMLCNLCVEACPFEAITMSDHYEMADYELEGIVFDKEELVEVYKRTNTAMVLAGHTWIRTSPG